MKLVLLRKFKLTYFLISLLLLFSFFNLVVKAEVDNLLLDEKNIELGYGTDNQNYNNVGRTNNYDGRLINKKIKFRKNPLEVSDSVFSNHEGVTLKNLIMRVSFIVLMLLGILVFLKMFLSKYRFDKPGSVFDNFAQKFHNTFSSSSGLKLKQTLMLTPGQNLYVIEIDERKLLVGGTHQGGVQFLADLTQEKASESLEFKKIEEYKTQVKQFAHASSKESIKHIDMLAKPIDNPFLASSQNQININDELNNGALNQGIVSEVKGTSATIAQIKQPLKRRTNFRQTLLSNVK